MSRFTFSEYMDEIARRMGVMDTALERISKLTPHAANAATADDLHATVKAIADTALADARGEA